MTLGHIIYLFLFLIVLTLPLLFRKQIIRLICTAIILFHSMGLIFYGLRLVARNVEASSQHHGYTYRDGWKDGVADSQELIDLYLWPITGDIFALAILANWGAYLRDKKQISGATGMTTGATSHKKQSE
jgi:hypothetical protein